MNTKNTNSVKAVNTLNIQNISEKEYREMILNIKKVEKENPTFKENLKADRKQAKADKKINSQKKHEKSILVKSNKDLIVLNNKLNWILKKQLKKISSDKLELINNYFSWNIETLQNLIDNVKE